MTITKIDNQRQTNYPVDPMFIERWSPRAFLDKEIPNDLLYTVLEAARWAPSAANIQPWRFAIAQTKEDKEKFYSFINEGNLIWCKKAPVLVALLSQASVDGKPNRAHAFDAGTAWGFLSLQAKKSGLVTHAMGGFNKELAKETLNLPDNYDVHVIIAIGYQGDVGELPEQLQDREKPSTRLPLEELIYKG